MKIVFRMLPIILFFLLPSWRTPENKTHLNFYGTVETHQSNIFEVNHITIGENKTKKIEVYELPKISVATPTVSVDQPNIQEITLPANPATDLAVKYMNLNEITAIQVPHPTVSWVYQRKKGYRKNEYIEIIITSKNQTQTSYLIERNTDVRAKAINQTGPEDLKVPFIALKKLTIAGCYYKLEQPDNRCEPERTTHS